MQKLFSYPGGKWPIRGKIISCFPPHRTYVDLFGGSASILIAKPPSKVEVYNDRNEEIVNFFRVVKHRPAELAEKARYWIHSRVMWEEKKEAENLKDEVARAFRFWVTIHDSFGGKGGTFGTCRKKDICSVTHARDYIGKVAHRLRSTIIECLDFRDCINRYDSPETFFYCDPPYPGTKGGDRNYPQLSRDDWSDLKDILSKIKGKFLLSSSNVKEVRSFFKGFFITTISVSVMLQNGSKLKNRSKRSELLIANYKLSKKGREKEERPRGTQRAGIVNL